MPILKPLVRENIKIAFTSIRSHKLRAILTILIISIGIMALIGILTAIESIKGSLLENFQMMGSNTFSITNRQSMVIGGGGHRSRDYKNISYKDAIDFRKRFAFPGVCSINATAIGAATVKYRDNKTNPNVRVTGVDENYLLTAGMELEEGRNFTANELSSGNNSIIIGSEIAKKLFNDSTPIDKVISINAAKYRVIGVLKSKGSSMGFSGDRECFINLTNLRQNFYHSNLNFSINYLVSRQELMDIAVDEATGIFRMIRKLKLNEEDNFSITKSDSIAQILLDNLKYVTLAAIIIALITLLGASVGLMNIMLVAVSERTREIGIRKALGATNKIIKNQFIIESVVITELGGVFGIFLGIIIGNMVSMFTGGSFVLPFFWIFISLIVSLVVGVISGIYPAIKASKLDPIESLRFE